MSVELTKVSGVPGFEKIIPLCPNCQVGDAPEGVPQERPVLIPRKHPNGTDAVVWVYHCPMCYSAFQWLDPIQKPFIPKK